MTPRPICDLTLNFDPRGMIQRTIVTPGHDARLNCVQGHDSTLNNTSKQFRVNCDPGSRCDPGSLFNVELWPCQKLNVNRGIHVFQRFVTRVIFQSDILTNIHIYLWNCDLWRCQHSVLKMQQSRRVIIQRKIHWILTPCSFNVCINAMTSILF